MFSNYFYTSKKPFFILHFFSNQYKLQRYFIYKQAKKKPEPVSITVR
ncbi:hypothetical protein CMALT394_410045 [Carnobacterium maltaromaticum]|nr:hypothetical protein CMALT394_410045 [Carnobacterium maltaromaticum]